MAIAWEHLTDLERLQLLTCRPDLNEDRQRAGRLGGLQTYFRHGNGHMSAIGKLGGRPKLRQQAALDVPNKEKRGRTLPGGLKELKGLLKQQRSNLAVNENGGDCDGSLPQGEA